MTLVARIDDHNRANQANLAYVKALLQQVEAMGQPLKPLPPRVKLSPVQPTEEEVLDGQDNFLITYAEELRRTLQSYKHTMVRATAGVIFSIVFALALVGLLTDTSWHTILMTMGLMAGSASASLAAFLFYHREL
jgi:uncharacterized membrane protein YagU involved in acid resistance